jgi:small subunit ribosomal protein S4
VSKGRRENKFKLDRRTGVNILSTSKSPVHTRNYGPGQHGKSKKVSSEYGKRLLEVAKLRHFYGDIKFKYLKSLFKKAVKNTAHQRVDDNLIYLLESRLSSVVYRAKFASSPSAARQLVSHKHILVNGKTVNISSYLVRVGDVIEMHESMRNNKGILESIASKERVVPNHMTLETNFKVKIVSQCSVSTVPWKFPINFQSISEFMYKYV